MLRFRIVVLALALFCSEHINAADQDGPNPPPSVFPEDGTKYRIVTGVSPIPPQFPANEKNVKVITESPRRYNTPPLVFPVDETKYKIVTGGPPPGITVPAEEVKTVKGNVSKLKVPPKIFPTDATKYKIVTGGPPIGQMPPKIFPTDATKYKIVTGGAPNREMPPKIFPKDGTKYKIIAGGPPPNRTMINVEADSAKNIMNEKSLNTPPKVFPQDGTKVKIVVGGASMLPTRNNADDKKDIVPRLPLIFPEDHTKYKIISNSTVLKMLTRNDSDNVSAESADMLQHQRDDVESATVDNKDEQFLKVLPLNKNPKLDSELYQAPGQTVEKDMSKIKEVVDLHGHVGKWLVVTVTATIALTAFIYSLIVVWKRSTAKHQFRRHMLVNEDEYRNEINYSEF